MSALVRVILEHFGAPTERVEFETIADAVGYLVGAGYTRLDKPEPGPWGMPVVRVSSRLMRGTSESARIDTTSSPNTWLAIVSEVLDRCAL